MCLALQKTEFASNYCSAKEVYKISNEKDNCEFIKLEVNSEDRALATPKYE
jgi:hypothetical protein